MTGPGGVARVRRHPRHCSSRLPLQRQDFLVLSPLRGVGGSSVAGGATPMPHGGRGDVRSPAPVTRPPSSPEFVRKGSTDSIVI